MEEPSRNGQIKIADEVIAMIAGTAARETEGVLAIKGDPSAPAGKQGQKGVIIGASRENVDVRLNIAVKYGFSIAEVSLEVQKRVKTALETMTGLLVAAVDVNVVGLQAEEL
jgi:uncharacterized alkaline shock family protein YloU